jgi:hypothetical protein
VTNDPNREPANQRCAGTRQTCREPTLVREPVPLCRNHGSETVLALLPALLGTVNPEPSASRRPRTGTREVISAEIATLTELIHTEGWAAVGLNRAIQVLGSPRATAAKRLAQARKNYATTVYRKTR